MKNSAGPVAVLQLLFALAALVVPFSSSASPIDTARCARVVATVDQVTDLDLLHECLEFYWHNALLDTPPGSYNSVIRLGYRVLVLDPQDEDTSTTLVWLLYSKYATWRKTPDEMPDGATKLDEALTLTNRVLAANPMSASLPLAIGHVFEGLVQYYEPGRAPLLFDLYERANRLASDDRIRIRARLDLGHAHRKYGTCADALRWYREVLAIDPQNAVALREIAKLSCAN